MKTLVITFTTAGKRNFALNIDDPKEDLTLDTVKSSAAALAKVLENKTGTPVTGFLKAEIVTETRSELE